MASPDPLRNVLDRDEKVLLHVERNLTPYWMMLAVAGMGFIAYGLTDPVYGWGVFFLGTVLLAFIGGALTSVRYHLTDRRLVRTGYLGTRTVSLRGATVTRSPSAFGETLTVASKGERLRVWSVRNGDAVAELVQRQVRA